MMRAAWTLSAARTALLAMLSSLLSTGEPCCPFSGPDAAASAEFPAHAMSNLLLAIHYRSSSLPTKECSQLSQVSKIVANTEEGVVKPAGRVCSAFAAFTSPSSLSSPVNDRVESECAKKLPSRPSCSMASCALSWHLIRKKAIHWSDPCYLTYVGSNLQTKGTFWRWGQWKQDNAVTRQ